MACRTVATPDGVMWICGEAMEDAPICRSCGHLATRLCDYPIGNDKTCDAALCDDCANRVRGDIDYCTSHSEEYGKILHLQRMEECGSGI